MTNMSSEPSRASVLTRPALLGTVILTCVGIVGIFIVWFYIGLHCPMFCVYYIILNTIMSSKSAPLYERVRCDIDNPSIKEPSASGRSKQYAFIQMEDVIDVQPLEFRRK